MKYSSVGIDSLDLIVLNLKIFYMLTKLRSKELSLNRNLLPFMLATKSPQICPRDGDTRPHMQMTVYKSDQVENAGHRLKGDRTDNHL